MKIFGKKALRLKESVYNKKDVILREDDKVGLYNVNGIVNGLNRDGDVTASNNNQTNTIDVSILTKNNKITPNDIKNSPEYNSAIKTAQKQPNTEVDITAKKVTGDIKPIGGTNSIGGAVYEGVVFTKEEMNKFLREL